MKLLFLAIYSGMIFTSGIWGTDLEEAKITASRENKYILLNFSGSDWCGPCIRMTKSIFEQNTFNQYAATYLVLVNADFPRMKKNQLSSGLREKNERLADKYNNKGIFPLTLLLNTKGEELARWEGLPEMNAEEFINNIQSEINAEK